MALGRSRALSFLGEVMQYRVKKNVLQKPTAWKLIIERVLMFVFPSANQDFHGIYGRVVLWVFEVDRGEIVREIGVDNCGNVIVASPVGENEGIFVGHVIENVEADECNEWNEAKFDVEWSRIQKMYE